MSTPRKVIKTVAFSSTAITQPLVSVEPMAGTSVDMATVAAFDDPSETTLPGSPVKYSDITMTVLDEGAGMPTIGGTVDTVSITATFWDGTNTVTRTYSRKMSIASVTPTLAEVQGNRVSSWAIVMHPVGGDNPATADGTTPVAVDSGSGDSTPASNP